MATKLKQEVVTARTRLDATLQHLVDKKDESQIPLETVPTISVLDIRATPSPSKKMTPSKSSRKRKRRDDADDMDGADEQQSVTMKLFDRSVDLALFPEDSSLYPVCRAWIHNRPQDKTLGTLNPPPLSPKKEEPSPGSDAQRDIYIMPNPIKSEDGCLYDLRVPEPIIQADEPLDIHKDPAKAPPAEQLLLQHMARWKEVRLRWHEASMMNEMQYASSVHILKEMYDRTMGET